MAKQRTQRSTEEDIQRKCKEINALPRIIIEHDEGHTGKRSTLPTSQNKHGYA